jgi:AcrR family transcriptional regulator
MAARRARVLRDQDGGDHPQALRHHLIGVTQRLLAAHGLTGLTTRGIARAAQVSDGVLYNHFADKDELVVTALAERLTQLSAQFHRDCPRPGAQDLRTGLTVLVRRCQQFQTQALPLLGAVITRPDLLHQLLARVHTTGSGPQLLWQAICSYLTAEQEQGTLAADVDPQTLTEIVFSTCQLHVLASMFGGHPAGPATDPATPDSATPDSATDPATPGPAAPAPAPDPGPATDRLVAFLLRACAPDRPAPE